MAGGGGAYRGVRGMPGHCRADRAGHRDAVCDCGAGGQRLAVQPLAPEAAGEAGFDDLVAVCQVGLSGSAKMELGKNYWDELGCGDLDAEAPPLVKGYLRAGAWICGEPAWDPDFNTADLPILMPIGRVDDRYARHFMGRKD